MLLETTLDPRTVLLIIHVIAGAIGLVAGLINLVRIKGDRIHRLCGKWFFYAMLTVSGTSLVLSVMRRSYFLLLVGVFTGYLVSTGYRYLSLKRLGQGQKVRVVDWMISVIMFVFGLGFCGFGMYHILKGITFAIVFLVFGLISILMVRADFRNYTGKSSVKHPWLPMHLQRMTGAYAAALTAFLVVNLPPGILPQGIAFVPWVLPTAVFTALIVRWSRKFRGD